MLCLLPHLANHSDGAHASCHTYQPLHVCMSNSVSCLQNKAVGKDHLASDFVDGAIKLTHWLYYLHPRLVLLFGLLCSCSWETVSKSIGGCSGSFTTKTLAVWLIEFLLCNVTKPLKETVTDPTWVQSKIATRHVKC